MNEDGITNKIWDREMRKQDFSVETQEMQRSVTFMANSTHLQWSPKRFTRFPGAADGTGWLGAESFAGLVLLKGIFF